MISIYALYKSIYDRSYHYLFEQDDFDNVIRQEIDNDWKLTKIINFFNELIHIIDNIYIGNAYNAANYQSLENLNIKLIVNVTKEIQNYFPENFDYYNIEILDSNKESLKTKFTDVIEHINTKKLTENDNILVHCYMGCSRSAAVIAAYILNKDYNLDETIELLKEKKNE